MKGIPNNNCGKPVIITAANQNCQRNQSLIRFQTQSLKGVLNNNCEKPVTQKTTKIAIIRGLVKSNTQLITIDCKLKWWFGRLIEFHLFQEQTIDWDKPVTFKQYIKILFTRMDDTLNYTQELTKSILILSLLWNCNRRTLW